jgi:hypothetical protein
MPVENGSRPRPFGLTNFAPDGDGAGGSSGNGKTDRPFTLLAGNIPLGKPIERKRRSGAGGHTEHTQSTLGEEINAYLEERARLRAEGALSNIVDGTTIITPADTVSLDLFAYDLEVGTNPTDLEKARSVSRIRWGFDALAFGLLSHGAQKSAVVGYELTQGFLRNHPQIFEDKKRLNGEEAAILAGLTQKVGLPFQARLQGITIPFAPTVAKMREIVGGKPLWEIPAPGEVPDHIDRYRLR